MKKIIVKVFALIFVLSTLFASNAFAATSGSTGSSSIHVETKANWLKPGSESITLKQNKATYSYKNIWGTRKTASIYPTYNIKIYNVTTGKTTNKTWKDSSIKLNLDRNCTYNITVSYDFNSTWLRSDCKLSSYTSNPYWYVSKTNKVSVCY